MHSSTINFHNYASIYISLLVTATMAEHHVAMGASMCLILKYRMWSFM